MTIFSFLLVTGFVGLLTWIITHKDDLHSKDGYFLGGRSLTFPIIAGSLLLTNLSTEQLVGLNGSAFTDGLCVMAWEVVAVIALVAMALFFLPKFLRSGIATLPEYLGIRFDDHTRMITSVVFLAAYAVILLPIVLYTGAAGLSQMLNVSALTGIENYNINLWLVVWLVGIIGAIYALFGGLRTVAVSDTINGVGLLTGGMLITWYGLNAVSDGGGLMEGWNIIKTANPERLNSIGGSHQSVPFATLFTGIMLLNMFYWCTNQQIIQRTFGASSLAEGQKGVLLTGLLKLLGPLYLVLPGIIAYYLFSKGIIDVGVKADGSVNSDLAYGTLVRKVLPAPLTGFFAAVMVGAILSSFNSALNSTCTIFSLEIYKPLINPAADEDKVVRSGKIFGWIIAVTSMSIAPFLAQTQGIFSYLQKMNGIYFIPIFAVVVVGMLSRRTPATAAKTALIAGLVIIISGYFIPPFNGITKIMSEYHFLGLVFVFLIVVMLIITKLKPRESAFVQQDVKAVDMTAWKYSKPVGILLLIAVALIYIFFADFSILK
ncbi:MAG: solute:sodium symporter family transporter [Victivallales bacterium]|nr:solute:sodium symporter family transporter [Victivallales bacterium]